MRRRRHDLGWLLPVGFAALVLGCYWPQNVPGPRIDGPLVGLRDGGWPAVAGLRLHVFNTGVNRVSPWLAGSPARWRPAPAFAIEHPRRGLLVFDCGLGPEIAASGEGALHPITRRLFRTRSRPGADLPAQMRAAGLAPGAVRAVLLSHLHFDHVGGARAFANADFYVGAGEREAAGSRMDGFAPAHTDWIPEDRWRTVDFAPGTAYASFDRSLDLFGDGSVVLVRGGGHSAGGMGALLALPGGPLLLAGDLVVHFDWLASDDVQRIVRDAARAADVRNRIRRLRELAPELVVLPGHDLRTVPRGREDIVLHVPDQYGAAGWPIGEAPGS